MDVDDHYHIHCCSCRGWSGRWGLAVAQAVYDQVRRPCESLSAYYWHRALTFVSYSPIPNNPSTVVPIILNDTSLAAVSLSNGDRHVFFQDNTGLVRRAVLTGSPGKWSTTLDLNITSNAKISTPLAATTIDDQIQIYYITNKQSLYSNSYQDGTWVNDSTLENYTTAVNSQQLSITAISSSVTAEGLSANTSSNITLLLYENVSGHVTALLQVKCGSQPVCQSQPASAYGTFYEWIDTSSQRTTSIPPSDLSLVNQTELYYPYQMAASTTLYESALHLIFGSPFTSQFSNGSDEAELAVQAVFHSPSINALVEVEYNSWSNESHGYFSGKHYLAVTVVSKSVDTCIR